MAALAMSALSRRDFVFGLLCGPSARGAPAGWLAGTGVAGAALSLEACRAAAASVPDGELLVPGKAAGHRLRDERPEPSAVSRFEHARVVIVGAGVAGLCAAWWLERAGVKDLRVLELDDAPGGTARFGTSEVTAYPWAAHYIIAPLPEQQNLVTLLGDMGELEGGRGEIRSTEAGSGSERRVVSDSGETGALREVAESALCREPEERIFYQGRWYGGLYLHAGANDDDHAQLARFRAEIARWVGYRDAAGRRAFALPASAASPSAEVTALDRESFASWLDRRGLSSPRLRWLADYACRDDYGLLAADTSAWAGLSYFASRIGEPNGEPQPVVAWPEGNGRVSRHLARLLGPRLRLGQAVSSVRAGAAGVELLAHTADGSVGYRAERVILATPHFINRRIVTGLARERAEPMIDRGAWAVANLHLDERPRARPEDAPLSWDNVLYDSPSLGYVVATHQSGRDYGPTVLTWYYPFTGSGRAARAELDGASREDWAAVALADLQRAHPGLRASCRRIDVAYWGHGMARPRVGSVFDPALAAAREPFGAIHFAGSELSGLSLFEEALDHGVRAAEEVLAALGRRS
jgi:monoamine oxidase